MLLVYKKGTDIQKVNFLERDRRIPPAFWTGDRRFCPRKNDFLDTNQDIIWTIYYGDSRKQIIAGVNQRMAKCGYARVWNPKRFKRPKKHQLPYIYGFDITIPKNTQTHKTILVQNDSDFIWSGCSWSADCPFLIKIEDHNYFQWSNIPINIHAFARLLKMNGPLTLKRKTAITFWLINSGKKNHVILNMVGKKVF